MSTSASIQAAKITFPNQLTSMAGILFVPPNLDKTKKYPALAVAHPFGGVKEQTAGTYARKMAEKGYFTLAFDATHQCESGGYPRDTENPTEKMEDIMRGRRNQKSGLKFLARHTTASMMTKLK